MNSEMRDVMAHVEERIKYLENSLLTRTPDNLSDVLVRQALLKELSNVKLAIIKATTK